jgi:hypothetical protein
VTENFLAVNQLIELIKNSNLSTGTNNMLEYLLYQLNLAMMRGERFKTESTHFPCKSSQIEELSGLVLAAGSEDGNCETAGNELLEKLSQLLDQIQYSGPVTLHNNY